MPTKMLSILSKLKKKRKCKVHMFGSLAKKNFAVQLRVYFSPWHCNWLFFPLRLGWSKNFRFTLIFSSLLILRFLRAKPSLEWLLLSYKPNLKKSLPRFLAGKWSHSSECTQFLRIASIDGRFKGGIHLLEVFEVAGQVPKKENLNNWLQDAEMRTSFSATGLTP